MFAKFQSKFFGVWCCVLVFCLHKPLICERKASLPVPASEAFCPFVTSSDRKRVLCARGMPWPSFSILAPFAHTSEFCLLTSDTS